MNRRNKHNRNKKDNKSNTINSYNSILAKYNENKIPVLIQGFYGNRTVTLVAPEHFDEYAKKYAELFKKIHSVSLAGKGLPSTSSLYLDYLDRLSGW